MSILVVKDLSKAFGGTQALSHVRLVLAKGQVTAVLGENGAGKSTLMNVLAGVVRPDSGTLLLDGRPFVPATPDEARRAGIALVPQEPELALHLSVEENIVLGSEPTRWGLVDRRAMRTAAAAALAHVVDQHSPIDPGMPAVQLSPSDRQRVVIARALAVAKPHVLILDEPTSSLTAADVDRLFAVIARLKAQGLGILYVSHFLEEVLRVADCYSVLRDGKNAGEGQIGDVSIDQLVAKMAGQSAAPAKHRAPRALAGKVVLSVKRLHGEPLPLDASLELHEGEVLGVAGLVGAGRSELLRSIFGLAAVKSGQLRVGSYVGPASPVRRLTQGVGLLSEDRKGEGLAMQLSILENLMMSRRHLRGPFVDGAAERTTATRFAQQLHIRLHDLDQSVSALSGGNQQKVALARLLHHDVDVLLLDEPTRGIDVGSRAEVHQVIRELAERGKAVLLVSSYLPELMSVCDRIAVMARGRLGAARPVQELDEHALLKEATGA